MEGTPTLARTNTGGRTADGGSWATSTCGLVLHEVNVVRDALQNLPEHAVAASSLQDAGRFFKEVFSMAGRKVHGGLTVAI